MKCQETSVLDAPLNRFFWICGGFGRGRFFRSFRDRRKWVQNFEKSDKVVPKGDRGESRPAEPRPRRVRRIRGLGGKKVRRFRRKENFEVQRLRRTHGDSKRRPDGSADLFFFFSFEPTLQQFVCCLAFKLNTNKAPHR